MNQKTKSILMLLLLSSSCAYGQLEQFAFKRDINGISEQWHTLVLPDQLFGKVSPSMSDLRIFGITANNDTIEAPYLLRRSTEKIAVKEVDFKTLNSSHNEKGYFFTFEILSKEPINQINLDFDQPNFDWRIQLEGSQNQQEWFTILDDYRILSIKNEEVDFQFTKLSFPNSRYHYYRLRIPGKEKPGLRNANILEYVLTEGALKAYAIESTNINTNKQSRQTEIDLELALPVPVSQVHLAVRDTFDYYRPVTIAYLSDSFKTEQGWKYNYRTLASGTLNSMEENTFKFNSTILKKLKITIRNQDNQPLTMDTFEVKGYIHELVARFTEPASFMLVYGNKETRKPEYDIDRFADKIPELLKPLQLGAEQTIGKEAEPKTSPLFENKAWLWAVMAVLILLLGWFMVNLMRKNVQ